MKLLCALPQNLTSRFFLTINWEHVELNVWKIVGAFRAPSETNSTINLTWCWTSDCDLAPLPKGKRSLTRSGNCRRKNGSWLFVETLADRLIWLSLILLWCWWSRAWQLKRHSTMRGWPNLAAFGSGIFEWIRQSTWMRMHLICCDVWHALLFV